LIKHWFAIHRIYHDTQYGFSIQNDYALFERLMLENNQAGHYIKKSK